MLLASVPGALVHKGDRGHAAGCVQHAGLLLTISFVRVQSLRTLTHAASGMMVCCLRQQHARRRAIYVTTLLCVLV
jgi:hypothetical protein